MTEQRNDKHDARLEALYREAGEAEPDAGLDRIIRARADEAVRVGRSANRLPWLGGLVTASVAIVAIAVVLQQTPPAERSPAIQGLPETETPAAFMAPSVGADAALKSSDESHRARSEIREMQSAGADRLEASPPPSAARRARAQSLSDEQHAQRLGEVASEQALNVSEPAQSLSDETEETAHDPAPILARIEVLIANEEIQRARDLLEAFRHRYPDHVVPEKIREAVAAPE